MKLTKENLPGVVIDIRCDVCSKSTKKVLHGTDLFEYGTLSASWGYASQHDGEEYEIHLCEPCFFQAVANLKEQRRSAMLFSDEEDSDPFSPQA